MFNRLLFVTVTKNKQSLAASNTIQIYGANTLMPEVVVIHMLYLIKTNFLQNRARLFE